MNKYTYLYVIQGNYGFGWDDLTQHENRREAYAELHVYNDNEPVAHRIIQRRELSQAA